MRRALIFLYFDPQGEVDDSTLHTIEGFRPLMDRILVVSNGELSSGAAARFNSVADDLLVRENTGFDVGAYRDALNAFGWDELRSYDQLTLANYTFFGPISSFAPVYERMENSGVDFWGITDHPALAADSATGMAALPAHLQSYWLTLDQRLINSDEFRQYWTEINDPVSYEEVIATFEARFTEYFAVRGFSWAPAYPHGDYGCTNPAMEAPLQLLVDGCPLFKKRLFFHDGPTLTKMGVSAGAVAEKAISMGYPEDRIVAGLYRRASTRSLAGALSASYLISDIDQETSVADAKVLSWEGSPWSALSMRGLDGVMGDCQYLVCFPPRPSEHSSDAELVRYQSALAVPQAFDQLIDRFVAHDRLGMITPYIQIFGAFIPPNAKKWFEDVLLAQSVAKHLALPDTFCRTFPIAPYHGAAIYRREVVEAALERITAAGGWSSLRDLVPNEMLLNRIIDLMMADIAKAAGFYAGEAGRELDVSRSLIASQELISTSPQVFRGYTAYPYSGHILNPTRRNRIGRAIKTASPATFNRLRRLEKRLRGESGKS